MQEDLTSLCISKDSTWYLEEGHLHVVLAKARKAETWPSVFKRHAAMDPVATTEVQKRLLLEQARGEGGGG